MKWKTLQAKTQGLKLNKLLNKQLTQKLNNEFDDKRIDLVNLTFMVRDSKIDNNSEFNLITLQYNNPQDLLLEELILDANNEENFHKIQKILEEFNWED